MHSGRLDAISGHDIVVAGKSVTVIADVRVVSGEREFDDDGNLTKPYTERGWADLAIGKQVALHGYPGPVHAVRILSDEITPPEEEAETGALDDKTVVELHELAKEEGAELQGASNKADIIKAIKKHRRKAK